MTQVETDLRAILQALSNYMNDLSEEGDPADAARVASTMGLVSAALSHLGAKDILATLPDPATSPDAKTVLDLLNKMQTAADDINNQVKDITTVVTIATGIANVISDVAGGVTLSTAANIAKTITGLI